MPERRSRRRRALPARLTRCQALRAHRVGRAFGLQASAAVGCGSRELDDSGRPVLEPGGGEAEGFEQAEKELRERAEHGARLTRELNGG
jgi:hypothetical protein